MSFLLQDLPRPAICLASRAGSAASGPPSRRRIKGPSLSLNPSSQSA